MNIPYEGTIELNMMKAWKSISKIKFHLGDGSKNIIWAYMFFTLVVIGLIYVIYSVIKDVEKEEYYKKLGITATIISIINIAISYLAMISFKIWAISDTDLIYNFDIELLELFTEGGSLKIFFPAAGIILATFAWIFTIGALLYYLKNKKEDTYNKIQFNIEKSNTKLFLGYIVLTALSFYLLDTKVLRDYHSNFYNYTGSIFFFLRTLLY